MSALPPKADVAKYLSPRSRTLMNLRPSHPHGDCAADRLLLGEGSGAGAERGAGSRRGEKPAGPEVYPGGKDSRMRP